MRALLVVNPSATTTTSRGRDVLTTALRAELDLEVAETRSRGDASALGGRAASGGFGLVVVLGGDGTVNEVVNGLLSGGVRPGLPALGLVPGGSTNVFARALGVPRDPVDATGLVLEAVRAGRRRTINLGRADDRYFTFCAGLGFDAEVVRAVDERRRAGATHSAALYVRTAVEVFYRDVDRRDPPLTLRRPGVAPLPGLHLAIVGNTAPWTYVGSRALDPTPLAGLDTGLDLLAVDRLGTAATLRGVAQLLSGSGRPPHGPGVLSLHDQDELDLTASRPVALQVDGEYLGRVGRVRLWSVPSALAVAV